MDRTAFPLLLILVLKVVCLPITGDPTPNNKDECINVSCINGSVTLIMEKSIMKEHMDCNHRLFNETEYCVAYDDEKSGVKNLTCQPLNHSRYIIWIINCDDKMRDKKTCFRLAIEGNPDKSSDVKSMYDLFWLLVLIPVALGIFGLYRCRKKANEVI